VRPVRPSVPDEVEAAMQRALALVPADRFADVTRFTRALREGGAADAKPPLRRRAGRRRLAIAALVVTVAAGWLLAQRRPAAPAASAAPRDPAAVALRERGLQAFSRRTPAGAREAIEAFGAAIRIDSSYAPAWAGLAEAYVQAYGRRFLFSGATQDSAVRLAIAAADRALLLDPRSSSAWVARGMVSRALDPTDLTPAIAAFRRAIAIDSTNDRAWFGLGTSLADVGDLTGGLDAWRRSAAVNPSNAESLAFVALGYFWRRQYDSAAAWADSAVATDPTFLLGRTTLGQVEVERGHYARARAAFEAARRAVTDVEALNTIVGVALVEARLGSAAESRRLLQEAESLAAGYVPIPSHTAVYLAHAYAAAGDAAAAIDWIGRVSPRDALHFQLHLRCDPPFDPLVADPRFQALLTAPRRPATPC
jgi:tetratricopeptide (TPR) repeat protein